MKNALKRPIRWMLWHTARCDNQETWWWNTVNHYVLGGPKHRREV